MTRFCVIGLRWTYPHRFATIKESELASLKKVGANCYWLSDDELWQVLETIETKTQDVADDYVEKQYSRYCFSCYEKKCTCCSEEHQQ